MNLYFTKNLLTGYEIDICLEYCQIICLDWQLNELKLVKS